MWKGLITMDNMAATFKETLEENALYRPYMINKNLNLSELLKGLNLNDWEGDDIYQMFGLWEVNSSRSNGEENLSGMNLSGNLTETDNSPILRTNEEVSSYVEEKLKRYGNISWKLKQGSPNHCERKRKNMSPTGEVVIARALKMRKSNSPKTPDLDW